jgi:hypothetical protein
MNTKGYIKALKEKIVHLQDCIKWEQDHFNNGDQIRSFKREIELVNKQIKQAENRLVGK